MAAVPSATPTATPSRMPSKAPTLTPSAKPSFSPTSSSTTVPTSHPSTVPSHTPSNAPSQQPTAVESALPSITPSTAPSISPSAQPAPPTPSPTQSPTLSLIDFCTKDVPPCDANAHDCSASYTIVAREEITDISFGSFDNYVFLCAAAAAAAMSSDSFSLTGLTFPHQREVQLSSLVVQASYTINVALGSYGYADSFTAYESITRRLNDSVYSGNFTVLLHNIGNYVSDAFAASNVRAISISFDPYIFPTSTKPTSLLDGSASSISGSNNTGTLSNSDFWYIIFCIIGVFGFLLVASTSWYIYRRYYRGLNPEKIREIRRMKRNSLNFRGEVIPEHGDVVDWSTPDGELMLQGASLQRKHDELFMAI